MQLGLTVFFAVLVGTVILVALGVFIDRSARSESEGR
jgi:hypothetical protein